MSTSRKAATRNRIPSQIPRNICIFIDGTWNSDRSRSTTNVLKLFNATPEGIIDGREQFKLYIQGVGKKPQAQGSGLDDDYAHELNQLLRREFPAGMAPLFRPSVGGGFGKGTTSRIKAAYRFLCEHYDKDRDDRVFLFGFSRGAFAARSLAGFINQVGLLLSKHLDELENAYEIYESGTNPAHARLARKLEKLTGIRTVSREGEYFLPIHFLGVWDTVASLGLPSRLSWLTAPYTEYHQVEVPPAVMTARHALALHELRSLFEPLLWKAGSHSDLKQVWFPGAHADVGGGYPADASARSDIALRWMAAEAAATGLGIVPELLQQKESEISQKIHHEIRGWFLATWPRPRQWLLDKSADLDSHYFHETAYDYLRQSDAIGYRFSLRHVNSALRAVDRDALARAILLRLHGREIAE